MCVPQERFLADLLAPVLGMVESQVCMQDPHKAKGGPTGRVWHTHTNTNRHTLTSKPLAGGSCGLRGPMIQGRDYQTVHMCVCLCASNGTMQVCWQPVQPPSSCGCWSACSCLTCRGCSQPHSQHCSRSAVSRSGLRAWLQRVWV